MNKKLKIFQALVALTAAVLLVRYSNWQTAAGVILAIWGSNFDFVKKRL